MTSLVYVLLLTYFLAGGNIVTNGVVAHSQADCEGARPLIQKIEQDRGEIQIGPKKYKINYVTAQCVLVPDNSV